MPNAFLKVGSHWINLDLVRSIEILSDVKNPALPASMTVHYCDGHKKDFNKSADVQAVLDWLQAHRAP
jgi:hypothetical protein